MSPVARERLKSAEAYMLVSIVLAASIVMGEIAAVDDETVPDSQLPSTGIFGAQNRELYESDYTNVAESLLKEGAGVLVLGTNFKALTHTYCHLKIKDALFADTMGNPLSLEGIEAIQSPNQDYTASARIPATTDTVIAHSNQIKAEANELEENCNEEILANGEHAVENLALEQGRQMIAQGQEMISLESAAVGELQANNEFNAADAFTRLVDGTTVTNPSMQNPKVGGTVQNLAEKVSSQLGAATTISEVMSQTRSMTQQATQAAQQVTSLVQGDFAEMISAGQIAGLDMSGIQGQLERYVMSAIDSGGPASDEVMEAISSVAGGAFGDLSSSLTQIGEQAREAILSGEDPSEVLSETTDEIQQLDTADDVTQQDFNRAVAERQHEELFCSLMDNTEQHGSLEQAIVQYIERQFGVVIDEDKTLSENQEDYPDVDPSTVTLAYESKTGSITLNCRSMERTFNPDQLLIIQRAAEQSGLLPTVEQLLEPLSA